MRQKIEFDAEKHIYRVNGEVVPSVSEILEPLTAKHYGEINELTLRLAAERGTAVHEACEELDYGFEPEVLTEYTGYVDAYIAFLQDYRPEWYGIEQMVYNPQEGYCGTIDRWGVLRGIAGEQKAIVDIKTTTTPTKANYITGACQLRMYGLALVRNGELDNAVKSERYLLYLKKDGKYRLLDMVEWSEKHDLEADMLTGALIMANKLTNKVK